MHVIAAKAVAFHEAMQPDFPLPAAGGRKCLRAGKADEPGYKLVSDGTDNHMVLMDLTDRNLTGKEAEARLGRAGITVNKNTVPNETKGPFVTSGIRIGVPLITSRGMTPESVGQVAELICDVLDDAGAVDRVTSEVRDLCRQYPLYPGDG